MVIVPTWLDWRHADRLGGRSARLIAITTYAVASIGFFGFGAPMPVRAALLGLVAGFCLPFAAEGTRRHTAHRRGKDRV
jgi:hypothetical protein